jgi:hypothetical protein
MYAALWRVLPGATWLKVAQLIVLAVFVLGLLVFVAFPFAADVFLVEDSVIGAP